MARFLPRRALALLLAVLAIALLAPAVAAAKARVVVVGTGGTIAGVGPDRTNPTVYRGGTLPIEEMVGFLEPEIDAVADVRTLQFGNRGSSSYSIAEFHALTLAVQEQLRTADAAVVTAGTDTMEEFAYWLDLTVRSAKPVVLTGSMRPWSAMSSDAQLNLFNAIRLAASGRTRCFGAVLMLNDEFHAARDVTKTNTYRTDTFSSRRKGVLGHIDGPNIKVDRTPPRRELCSDRSRWLTPFDLTEIPVASLPRVELVTTYQDAGGESIRSFADAGVRGIVTAGAGAGGDLLPAKARLLLLLSLAASSDPATVREYVVRYGNPEFTTPVSD